MRSDVTLDEWIAALESERYHHGQARLARKLGERTEHCCLGVLLDIAGCTWDSSDIDHLTYEESLTLRCQELGSTTEIPRPLRHLLGPEIHEALNRMVSSSLLTTHRDDRVAYVAHDVLSNVNDNSNDGYVPIIKILRQIQEEVT